MFVNLQHLSNSHKNLAQYIEKMGWVVIQSQYVTLLDDVAEKQEIDFCTYIVTADVAAFIKMKFSDQTRVINIDD